MDFRNKYSSMVDTINGQLEKYLATGDSPEKIIHEAMKYSVSAGGKRLRPVLSISAAELLGLETSAILPYACALEMIHTYSLIHDDLPAMDNDVLRRGMPTCHIKFGEAVAILAGDALLNKAFEIMSEDAAFEEDDAVLRRKVNAMKLIGEASGTDGMIAGQTIDIESQGKSISYDTLRYMHNKKTGALIKAAVLSPGVISGADEGKMNALRAYSENLGLAFQIKDDILGVEGTTALLGKTVGIDVENDKMTFVTAFGLEKSREMLKTTTEEAVASLCVFGESGGLLAWIAAQMAARSS